MLIAIVSDTHLPRGTRAIPPRCWELMARSDLIIHAGDFTSEAVLGEIESLGPPVRAVHGNMDSLELRRRLPAETLVRCEGATIAVVHDGGPAAGRLERLRRRHPDADAVVFGHSHVPLDQRHEGFRIFNPGSPTERRRAPGHTMGLARVEKGEIEFELVELD